MKWTLFFGFCFILFLLLRIPLAVLGSVIDLPPLARGDVFHGSFHEVSIAEIDTLRFVFNPDTVIDLSWDFLGVTWRGIEYAIEVEQTAAENHVRGLIAIGFQGIVLRDVTIQSDWTVFSESWRAGLSYPEGRLKGMLDRIVFREDQLTVEGSVLWEEASVEFLRTKIPLGDVIARVTRRENYLHVSFDNQSGLLEVSGQARLQLTDGRIPYTLEASFLSTDQTPQGLRTVLSFIGSREGEGRQITFSGVLTR